MALLKLLPVKFLCSICFLTTLFSCRQNVSSVNNTPQEYEGEWKIVKKIYSSGIEENYPENKDVYYLLKDGKLRRSYLDRNEKTIDEEGEWKIIKKSLDKNVTDSTYLIKRMPMFNGVFEEQFRIISKSEKELILEENDWGFENSNARDRLVLSKK